MLKRFTVILFTLCMCFATLSSFAELSLPEDYADKTREAALTDVVGTPTQDSVKAFSAKWLDDNRTPYEMMVMPSDQNTMDKVTEIYRFVYEQGNHPIDFYPKNVKEQIASMYGVNPEALNLTEFMRFSMPPIDPTADLEAIMTLAIEYQPGQLVVILLGNTVGPESIEWIPINAEVVAVGTIRMTIPLSLMKALQGHDILFNLMAVRQPNTLINAEKGEEEDRREQIPSKSAYDLVIVRSITSAVGAGDEFRLLAADETETITKEVGKIRAYLENPGRPFVGYLPRECRDEIQQLLNENDRNTQAEYMFIHEYVPLITVGYVDGYGDATATIKFPKTYEEGLQVVTVLGLPKENAPETAPTLLDWNVQRAKVNDVGEIEIIFKQKNLSAMGEKTAILLLMCEPIPEE